MLQLGLFRFILETRHSTPWLIRLGPIHIVLQLRLRHHWAPAPLDGLLDPEAFLVTWTLLHTDLSLFWLTTLPYRNWLIAANLTVNTTWLWLVQTSKMLLATNLKLCSPGHVRWDQWKPASFPLENYVSAFQKDWGPNGTSSLTLRIWSFAIATWKVIHSKSPMVWRSCSFWRNTDPNGDSDSTTTLNPPCSSRVPHSLSCYVCDATKLPPVWSFPDTLTGQKKTMLEGLSFYLWQFFNTKDSWISILLGFELWPFREPWTTWWMTGPHFYHHYGYYYSWAWLTFAISWYLSFCRTISRISDRFTHGA